MEIPITIVNQDPLYGSYSSLGVLSPCVSPLLFLHCQRPGPFVAIRAYSFFIREPASMMFRATRTIKSMPGFVSR